jgi:DNA-binding transcriptional ArsR family regulator
VKKLKIDRIKKLLARVALTGEKASLARLAAEMGTSKQNLSNALRRTREGHMVEDATADRICAGLSKMLGREVKRREIACNGENH